jgi:chromosome partitioning protein
MRVIAITNQKGGVGKTTTAVNLATCLAEKKKRVLLIDVDSQANATAWLGNEAPPRTLLEVYTEGRGIESAVQPSRVKGVDILPSSPLFVSADRILAGEIGAEQILKRALASVPDRWDFVLIDCPPSLSIISVSALVAASEVLVPVETSYMALSGLAQLKSTLEQIQDRLNPDLVLSAILPCRVDYRTRLSREVIEDLRKHFGNTVLKTTIRQNIRLTEAPSYCLPITEYAPTSSGAKDYRSATKEFLKRRIN